MPLLSHIFFVLSMFLVVGCSFFENETQKITKERSHLIDRMRDMSILRTDNKQSATIRFFTAFPAYCRVEYWAVTLGDNPDQSLRKQAACFRSVAGQSHFVRIEGLSPTKPQFYRLIVSGNDPKVKQVDDRLILKETTTQFSYFPPNNLQDELDDPLNVTVIKANLTQASAIVYSNRIPSKVLDSERKQFLKTKFGCDKLSHPIPSRLLPPRSVGLTSVSTKGYFTTNGVVIDRNREVFLLDFTGKIESQQKWFFAMDFSVEGQGSETKDYEVPSPPEMSSVVMETPLNRRLVRHDLVYAPKAVEVTKDEGLQFSWKGRNTKENDYLEVIIGKPSQGEALRCQFPMKDKVVTIPPDELAVLNGHRKDVIVSLNRKVVSQTHGNHVVFLHTHDWRYINLVFK
ncbi:MAG: hypothetical protein OXC40_00360 [Proteobacteria bacterium]|nr:hypothetical protein [Pseudomonadota bacterium]